MLDLVDSGGVKVVRGVSERHRESERTPTELGSERASMTAPKVFISYRRSDAGGYAGRLYDVLTRAGFEVFVDVDKIGIGGDFVEIIKRSVSSTDALLALIGPEWLTATKADGTRRLDDPRDFVR